MTLGDPSLKLLDEAAEEILALSGVLQLLGTPVDGVPAAMSALATLVAGAGREPKTFLLLSSTIA